MDKHKFIGNNRPEDVSWLCSLSEAELDMLMSLKNLAIQRAKVVGHESLAQKFDLKMLRALDFIVMQYVNGKMKDLQLTGLAESKDLLDGCNLLNLDLKGRFQDLRNENLTVHMNMDNEKRRQNRLTPVASDIKIPKGEN